MIAMLAERCFRCAVTWLVGVSLILAGLPHAQASCETRRGQAGTEGRFCCGVEAARSCCGEGRAQVCLCKHGDESPLVPAGVRGEERPLVVAPQ